MVDLKNIDIGYKFSAIFACIGFILSFLIGVVSGFSIGLVIIRTLIITIGFAGLGFGIIMVIRNYVPELYTLLNGESKEASDLDLEEQALKQDDEIDEDSVERTESVSKAVPASEGEGGFAEFSKEDFPTATERPTANADSSLNMSEGKMGKHIIAEESKFSQYEPKIIAEAIRTMIGRDSE